MHQTKLKQILIDLADADASRRDWLDAAAEASRAKAASDGNLYIAALDSALAVFPSKSLDHDVLQEAARTRMDIALRLGELSANPPLGPALAACSLLDVGKAALDTASESGINELLDSPGPVAAPVLESETETHGADHALAGKWLAEYWKFPVAVSEAIWLHHHTLSTVELAAEHPQVCYFVMLADALSGFARSGTTPATSPWIESLCKRLGLRAKDVLATVRQHEPTAKLEVLSPAPVRKAKDRYRVLCGVHATLHSAASADDVALALATAMRDGFDCPSGACTAMDAVATWNEHSDVQLHRASDAEVAGARNSGNFGLPLKHRDIDYGHVGATLPSGDIILAEELLEISALLESGAAILARIDAAARSQTRSEALASALHTAEAQRQRTAQVERLGGLARFAAGAAHEINNPLAAISGRAQLLLSRAADDENARALDAIVQQSQRIGKIVNDLMQFARPPEPRWASADVAELLRQVIAPTRDRLQQKHIVLAEEFGADLPRVRVDRHQMDQALSQGLLNAEQALSERGGRIVVSARAVRDGAGIEISIRDNGGGIAAENLEKVFDPFFTTKQFNEGSTGLGLAVCRGIVEAHSGEVRIASRIGDGTTLTISLPAAQAAVGAPAKAHTPVAAAPAPAEAPTAAYEDARDAELGIAVQPRVVEPVGAMFLEPWDSNAAPAQDTAPPVAPEVVAEAEAIVERVFPRVLAPRVTAPPAIVPAQGSILVIEENEDLREVLRAALASRGFVTNTAPDGLEGLASALAHPPDLIVCATQLSGVDALTLVRQVRQRFAGLPIIALGGPGPDEIASEVLRAGARALLHKPFDFDRLLQEISQFLATRNVA